MLPDVNLCLSSLHVQQVIKIGLGGVNNTSDVKNSLSAAFQHSALTSSRTKSLSRPSLVGMLCIQKETWETKGSCSSQNFSALLGIWEVTDCTQRDWLSKWDQNVMGNTECLNTGKQWEMHPCISVKREGGKYSEKLRNNKERWSLQCPQTKS